MRLIRAVLKSKQYSYDAALLRSRRSVNFKGKNCVSHVPQRIDKRADNFCKQRAECLRRSLVLHTAWSVAAIFYTEKSACLVVVSVTEQILRKFPNSQIPGGTELAQTVYQPLPPTHESPAWEPGNEANQHDDQYLFGAFISQPCIQQAMTKPKESAKCHQTPHHWWGLTRYSTAARFKALM